MGRPRSELQMELESLPGLKEAYFQPPASVKLKYDCIVYSPQPPGIKHADNRIYLNTKCYRLILISKDPDCALADVILEKFEHIEMTSVYHTENLHHWAYTLFY